MDNFIPYGILPFNCCFVKSLGKLIALFFDVILSSTILTSFYPINQVIRSAIGLINDYFCYKNPVSLIFSLLPITHYPIPNPQSPIPITHYLLPITYYPLPITHYPSFESNLI
ncbi:MAG: hypothetical protein ACRCT1_05280 [Microcoleaceae cyanobacterium]